MDVNLGSGIDGPTAAEQITSYGYIVKHSGDTVLLASVRMAFRLFDAVEASRRLLATILEVSSRLIETLDLQAILQTASNQLAEISGVDGGAVYLIDRESVILEATTPALPVDFPEHLTRAPLSEHPHILQTIETRSPVLVEDTAAEQFTLAEQEAVRLRSLRSILYVPLISHATPIGVFITGSTEAPVLVAEEIMHLCTTLANIVAVAANNAIMAAATDGSFAAYVGIAHDGANGQAVFEPVRTHPDHRRRGLAASLMREGLHRLRAHGAQDVVVGTGDQVAARRLYESLGFTETYIGRIWKRG